MHIFVKEMLYLLDYNDNILDTLFISTDKRTPGYAYEINIIDNNTGHSDLNFRMPCDIITKDGEKIRNPKLEMLKPLSKVRYNRQIIYQGTDIIEIPDKGNTTITIPKNNGENPEDYILEDYVMDYIIQPLDKSRENIGIGLLYTAIDFPRFNLSKKKLGLTFNEQTITDQDLSLYKNKPLSIPGSIQYIPWTADLMKQYQTIGYVENESNLSSQPAEIGDIYYVKTEQSFYKFQDNGTWLKIANDNTEITWEPNPQTGDYPLSNASIKKLVKETDFSYGILSTIYYWPVTKTGRFQGVRYEKNGFITLSLYNTYEGSDWEGSDYLNSITWKWGVLSPIEHYLLPNNACNYLRYIIKGTNWKVKGDKDNFIINTNEQPWFNDGSSPANGEDGQYYITMKELEEGYNTKIFRYEDDKWVEKTNDTFAQIVNMDKDDPDFGTLYDIDIEQVRVPRADKADFGHKIDADAIYKLSVSNANCYNAITSEAKLFNLYPIFDCINKTISLKLNVGADYGLTYRFKENLKNSNVKVDGEKVITKLYVTGGTDANGSKEINLGEATRSISGIEPTLVSNNANNYDFSTMNTTLSDLEENAYNNMMGIPLTVGVDMSDQSFKLEIPDNLYELKYTEAQLNESTAKTPETLYTFSSGKKIDLLYNPTGSDYCFYIYLNDGVNAYKDETKQLYKFDYSNHNLRRNLEIIDLPNIGTVTVVNLDSITRSGIPIANYIKYSPSLDNQIYKDNKIYKGNEIVPIQDGKYYIDTDLTKEFVLVGPNRVYNIPIAEEKQYNYTVGNYYHRLRDDMYLYCINSHTDSGSIYSKLNTIAINGYLLVELGTSTTPLLLNTSNIANCNVYTLNDELITLKEWCSNNFALRVKYDNNIFKEVDNFNPNNQEYLMKRSPYGETYIYNFKYLYDNGWMTKEQILRIYEISSLINNLNLDFYERYTKDLVNTRAKLEDAFNNQEVYASKADAQLNALMSQYWINPNKASDGEIYAFPGVPQGSTYDSDKKKYYVDITYPGMPDKRVYFNVFTGSGFDDLYPHAKDNNTKCDNPESEGQYHVVAKALGWDDNYSNTLTINSELSHYTESEDPSKTAESYNDFIKHMKEYYYKTYQAEQAIEEANQAMKDLEARYKVWEKQRAAYEKELQENFSQYLIEGSYSNPEQPYSNLLLEEGLEASDKYATPDITYDVGVVDASGLIEYRAPQKHLCNRLVKRLHSLGQIAPKVGDYVAIQDEPMGMFGVPGLITQISRRVDNPYQNNIIIDTSYSDADELVGNIITATNTVLSNKDIYGRMAIINNKGELSSTAVNNALSNGESSINIVSTNGKVTVDDNGLTCINPYNTNHVIKYNGAGVLTSKDSGSTWNELLNQDGINANYIKSGTINAGKVSITDGGHDITVLNGDGLTVKENPGKPYKKGYLDTNGAHEFDNVTVFVGRDSKGEGAGYFSGYINATKGGNIGGWEINSIIDPNNSQFITGGSLSYNNNTLYLGTTGISANIGGTSRDNLIFKAGSNFGVNNTGKLYANEAKISGDITANSLTLGSSVDIPESNIDALNTYIKEGRAVGQITNGHNSIGFNVSTDGLMRANNAIIYGDIYAKNGEFAGKITSHEGEIGGWQIKNGYLGTLGAVDDTVFLSNGGQGAYINQTGTSPNCVLYAKGNFAVTTDGTLYANSGFFTGNITSSNISSASISASTISGTNISGGTISGSLFRTNYGYISNRGTDGGFYRYRTELGEDGRLVYYNNTGFIRCGKMAESSDDIMHPYMSALNLAGQLETPNTNGSNPSISFRNSSGIGSAGDKQVGYITYGTQSGGRYYATGNMNILGEKNLAVDAETGYVRISSGNSSAVEPVAGSTYITASKNITLKTQKSTYLTADGFIRISAGNSSAVSPVTGSVYVTASNNVTLRAGRGGHVYAGANDFNGGSNSQVETEAGTVSSLITKTNLQLFKKKDYSNALDLLQNMNLYSYDYKYDLYDHPSQYGFIIDEVEKQDKNNFFDFTEKQALVRGRFIDFNTDDKIDNCKMINVKEYNRDTFTKYLLTCVKGLQQEIEELKLQIKKEKTI